MSAWPEEAAMGGNQGAAADLPGLFDALPHAALVVREGRIAYANRGSLALFGAAALDDLLGTAVLDLISPDFHAPVQAGIAQALAGGRSGPSDIGALRVGGAKLRAELNITALTVQGTPAALLLLRDLYARTASEARLARTNGLYTALIHAGQAMFGSGDLAALGDEMCRIAVEDGGLSTAALRLLDRNSRVLTRFAGAGAVSGRIGVEPVPLDDPESATAHVAREARPYVSNDLANDPIGRSSRTDAVRLGLKSRAIFPLMVSGECVGVFVTLSHEAGFFDEAVSRLLEEMARSFSAAFAQRRAEAALVQSESRYRMLFDANPVAIRIITNLRTVLVNPACVRLLGYRSAAEMIGRPANEIIDPAWAPAARSRLLAVLEKGESAPPTEQAMLRADGSRVMVETRALPIEFEGQPAALSIIRDLTERKAAEKRVQRLTNLYAALSKTNEAIFRSADMRELCESVCEIAVRYGGFTSAAIRRLERETRMLVPYAGHGPRQGGVGADTISFDDPQSANARALRNNEAYISNDFGADPNTRDVTADAQAVGVRAAAVYPLTIDGDPAGTLSVFAAETGYFDAEISGLLVEIARNMSYAFSKLRAAQALSMSEERYRALFDASPDAVRVIAGERVVLVNPACVRLFGHADAQAAMATSVFDTVAPEGREEARRRVRSVITERRPLPYIEQRLLRTDGSSLMAEAIAMPIEWAGKPAVLSIIRDLTEKKAQAARVERLSNFYVALSRTNETIFRENNLKTLCRKVCELAVAHGGLLLAAIRLPDAHGHLVSYVHAGADAGPMGVSPVDPADPRHPAAQVWRTGTPYIVNQIQADPDSQPERREAAAAGVGAGVVFALTVAGAPVGLLSVFASDPDFFDPELTNLIDEMARNLSFAFERERNAAALAASQQSYRSLFESSPDAIRVIQQERIVMLNPAGLRLFGVAAMEEIVGQSVYDHIDPVFQGDARERFRIVTAEKRPTPPVEQVLVRADGVRLDVEVVTLPFDYEGRPAALTILHDLTARKAVERATMQLNAELEERVQRRTAELKRANADLEAFSYTVAHDLRAPLRRMSGYAALLENKLGIQMDEEAREFIARIQGGSDAMARLIEGLLEIARVGRAELKPAQIDLSGVAAALAHEYAARVPGRMVEFVITPSLTAYADPRLVRDVLDNLLGNAWKFTSTHARARIEFGALEPGVAPLIARMVPGTVMHEAPALSLDGLPADAARWRVFYVRDDGAGFDPRYASKLFGAFQRLHSHNEFPGTGIGLASSSRIIAHHGGRIWAEGEPEKGATFYFSLPLRA
ncbi:MAG TPA: PAS domain S-box protein [Burkholderiales bacterium]